MDQLEKVRASVGVYDRLVYLDLDNCGGVEVVADEFRDTDLDYRKEIDQLFKYALAQLGPEFVAEKVNANIKGSRVERVDQFQAEEGARFACPNGGVKMDKTYPDGYRVTDTHVFFWGSFLSNFERCKFEWRFNPMEDPHVFFCTEQAFMWAKARFFKDNETAETILAVSDDPHECKQLGRKVSGYVDEDWAKVRYHYMVSVNLAKYTNCKYLRDKLLDPLFDGKEFVEASPYDGIWGIKMGIGTPGVTDPANWKGQNLLGRAITEVRKTVLLDAKKLV
jgi:ribA/ribD-fused uncharacterized protein